MSHMSTKSDDILDKFISYTNNPSSFLKSQENLEPDVKSLLKNVYDLTKQTERIDKSENKALTHLLVHNFDTEQIWQQLELYNSVKYDQFKQKVLRLDNNRHIVHKLFSQNEELTKHTDSSGSEDNDDDNVSNDDDGIKIDKSSKKKVRNPSHELNEDEVASDTDDIESDEDDASDRNTENEEPVNISVGTNYKRSIVDDDFFKLSEMEQFLINEEKIENQPSSKMRDSEFIDYFADIPDESEHDSEGENKVKYSDFFENPNVDRRKRKSSDDQPVSKKKKVRFNLDDDEFSNSNSDSDIESAANDVNSDIESAANDVNSDIESAANDVKNDESKSTYELRKERINKHIENLEEGIIAEKPWQMKGEITAKKRPQNSLLEEVLEFNLTTRPAPIITEEVTLKLEDIILRRIKDKAWDDVERKIKPVDTPSEFKKKLILNQEKSKFSLAEVYEKEYIKQRDDKKNKSGNNQNEEEPAEHKRIRSLMDLMFKKLDALSNYHFTPMPIAPKIDIVHNLPAISMEEPAPVSISDAALLAPEEIQEKSKGDPLSKPERTDTDKKRDRRKKKLRQRERRKEVETKEKILKRLNVGMGNKYSKEKIQKELDHISKMKNVGKLEEKADAKKKNISSKVFFEQLNETSANPGLNEQKKKNRKQILMNTFAINTKKK